MRARRALVVLLAVASVAMAGCPGPAQEPGPRFTNSPFTQTSPSSEPSVDELTRHRPVLRYHAGNRHPATSADMMADDPATVLRRGSSVIARHPELGLDYLGPMRYGDGGPEVSDEDVLDGARECGTEPPLLGARPYDESLVYPHVVKKDGETWLQYWLFFVCNDAHPGRPGDHAGDWELIELRLDPATRIPNLVVLSQHSGAQSLAWAAVEKDADDRNRIVVYVADGTHALFFAPGNWWAPTALVYDCANGLWQTSHVKLVRLDGQSWVLWPGRWGANRKWKDGRVADSPLSPGVREVWRDPASLLGNPTGAPRRMPDGLRC